MPARNYGDRISKKYTFSQTKKCGNVTFLSPNKNVTKEVGIGEALRKSALPYVPHPPLRHPIPENVPIFGHLHKAMWQHFEL